MYRIGTRLVLVVAFAAAVVLMAVRGEPGVAAAGDEIVDPAPFEWSYVATPEPHFVGVLEYGRADFTLNNGDTLTTRAYRQEGGQFSVPGPTIAMEPGNTYVLRFRNLLDYQAPSGIHNDFKDPNITNVHTHGLHISGESPSDDVTRMFEGGFGGDYVYDIPADHMGGTYWYHAHHHGSTYLQVSTGGFGLIVIDDSEDGLPAEVAAMDERQLIVAFLDTSAAGTGGDALISGTLAAGWTVNGKVGGTVTVPPDTWEHWRILLADADARTKDLVIGGGCETMLLARDGVWRTVAPKPLATNTVNLTGASRADLAVRCIADTDIRVGNQVVATVDVDATLPSDTGPSPWATGGATWSADRPSYLRDLRGVSSVNSEKISMGARTVNGSKFDIDTPTFTLPADDVQHWSIKGAVNHPFHLHVYHFQAQAGCPGDFEAGEYYDTIAGNCSVRFDLDAATSSPFEGMTIMHCHILGHEDQGAMTWMDVIGGAPPPSFPAGQGYDLYYALGGEPPGDPPAAPSGLAATAASHAAIDLTWIDNSSDESGFTIERTGAGDTVLIPVGADVTARTDTGLLASTTYTYRVRADNAAGSSAWSTAASATTHDDPGGPTAIAEPVVTAGTLNVGKGWKHGTATVTVTDDLGQPVAGATVSGSFSGTFNEGFDGLTGSDGTVTFTTTDSAKGGVTVTFCVTSVVHSTLTDWTGDVCATA